MMDEERKAVTDLLDSMMSVRDVAKRHSSDMQLVKAIEGLFKSGIRAVYQLCKDGDARPNDVDPRILDTDFYKGPEKEDE